MVNNFNNVSSMRTFKTVHLAFVSTKLVNTKFQLESINCNITRNNFELKHLRLNIVSEYCHKNNCACVLFYIINDVRFVVLF